ncbi:MAG TPA: YARHG domain-containing protein, partial [Thermoanaerobaculia bacterium]
AGYDWYTPAEKQPVLTKLQLNNVEVISARERELHDALATKNIEPSMLEGLFTEDLKRLRNEVYARHGRTFKDKELNEYFTSFGWYKPDPAFKEASLSPIELANVDVIRRLEEGADSRISFEG